MSQLKILLADDHPIIRQGYKIFLDNWSCKEKLGEVSCIEASNLEEGLKAFSVAPKSFDLAILDVRMPCCSKNKLYSGEDLGQRLKKMNPHVKIVIITSLTESFHLHNIFKNLNPEGIIIKTDLNEQTFIKGLKTILSGLPFYSESFVNMLRNQYAVDYVIDQQSRELLYFLSIGVRTSELPNKIHLSLSSIEKRKKAIRKFFGIENNNDLELVYAAKERGFI